MSFVHTKGNIESLPSISCVSEEVINSPSYYNEGAKRKAPLGVAVFTLSGSGSFRHRSKDWNLPVGSAFLCDVSNPDIVYYYPKDAKEPWRFVWMTFLGGGSLDILNEFNEKYGFVFNSIGSEFPQQLKRFQREKENVLEILPSRAAKTVMELFECLETSRIKERKASGILKKAMDYADKNLENNISVESLAKKTGVSREHMSRIFNAELGISPSEYIIKKKIFRAGQLLAESDMSCKEIAFSLGYGNQANFSRAFTKIMKISPQKYRKHKNLPFI
jgi:AraC-like DNA-binding protein